MIKIKTNSGMAIKKRQRALLDGAYDQTVTGIGIPIKFKTGV